MTTTDALTETILDTIPETAVVNGVDIEAIFGVREAMWGAPAPVVVDRTPVVGEVA